MSGRPPRLLVKTLAVTFLTVAILLVLVLIVVTVSTMFGSSPPSSAR